MDGKEGLYLDIFLRGDPDDHGEPDDPGGTKIYFESLIWITRVKVKVKFCSFKK